MVDSASESEPQLATLGNPNEVLYIVPGELLSCSVFSVNSRGSGASVLLVRNERFWESKWSLVWRWLSVRHGHLVKTYFGGRETGSRPHTDEGFSVGFSADATHVLDASGVFCELINVSWSFAYQAVFAGLVVVDVTPLSMDLETAGVLSPPWETPP